MNQLQRIMTSAEETLKNQTSNKKDEAKNEDAGEKKSKGGKHALLSTNKQDDQ